MGRTTLSLLLSATLLTGAIPPDSPQIHQATRDAERSFDLALKLERAGNTEQALAIYTRLVEEFPGNMRYYQRLKNVLRNTGQFEELLPMILNHLERYPNDLPSLVELGDVHLALGNKSEAIQTWEGILQRFPGNNTAERLVLTHLYNSNLVDTGNELLTRLRDAKGDSSFFALEMGRLYTVRLRYDLATEEFLRYLDAQPRAAGNVTGQILRFPAEPEVIDMLREKLSLHGTPAALRILTSVEFKHRNFPQAVDLYRRLGAQPAERMNLGIDLLAEGEWDLAQQVMEELLADPGAANRYEQAILTLARVHEERSKLDQPHLPLSGFYQGNRFFTLPFIRVDESRRQLLRQAMVLYDSVITTWHNPLARLRLGDIKTLILDDYDGAMTDFQAVLTNRSAVQYHPDALLRLIDVWIAKGDLEAAELARRRAASRMKTREQLTMLEIKAVELLFLSGHRDSLLAHIGGQMAALGPADPHFNDLMELSNLVQRFQGWPAQYQTFIAGERFLRQNRRSEAIALLAADLEGDITPVSPILQFRLAHLLALQGNYTEAEDVCFTIPEGEEFAELGLLLAAELADHLMVESQLASTRYLAFLDTFPLSIYGDAVRLRYRELNPEGD